MGLFRLTRSQWGELIGFSIAWLFGVLHLFTPGLFRFAALSTTESYFLTCAGPLGLFTLMWIHQRILG